MGRALRNERLYAAVRLQLEISLNQGCEAVLAEVYGFKLRPLQKLWPPGLQPLNVAQKGFVGGRSQHRFFQSKGSCHATFAEYLNHQHIVPGSSTQSRVQHLLSCSTHHLLRHGAYRGFAAGRVKNRGSLAERLHNAWKRAQEKGAKSLPPVVAKEAQHSLHWWQAYLDSMPSVASYMPSMPSMVTHFTPPPLPSLPSWVRARLPHWPEGWSSPSAWLPYDWAARPGFEARVAILNAMYTMGGHVQRLLPILITEAIRRDRYSYAYALSAPPQTPAVLLPVEEVPWGRRGPIAHALATAVEVMLDLMRATMLLFLFSPIILTGPWCQADGWQRRWWLRTLRETLESAGPAFIKWGQWASTRADMFPPDMCRELEGLQTKAPAHALAFTEQVIERAYGAPISLLFDTFESEPVASGSIGAGLQSHP
eukprot:jgi/Botrbrau1/20997/Bobra.0144s0015.1